MKEFTASHIEAINAQAKEILEQLAGEKSILDILAQIYVDNLEDKTKQQGEVVAGTILKEIEDFDSDFNSAKANVTHYVDHFIEQVCVNKTAVERCNYLLKLSTAIGGGQALLVIQSDEQEKEMQALMAQVEATVVSEEEATPVLEAELREKVKEALLGSSVMMSALVQQADALKEIDSGEEAAELLLDMGAQEVDYRAITAMLAYVNIKKGMFEEMPAEMTVDQVTTLVCAQSEQIHILEAVEQGKMAIDVATAILQVLGMVVIGRLCLSATGIGIGVCTSVFGCILIIPSFLVLLMGMVHVLERGITAWSEESTHITHRVATSITLLVDAASRVIDFGKTKVFPMAVEGSKKLLSSIKGILYRLKMERNMEQGMEEELMEEETEAEETNESEQAKVLE